MIADVFDRDCVNFAFQMMDFVCSWDHTIKVWRFSLAGGGAEPVRTLGGHMHRIEVSGTK